MAFANVQIIGMGFVGLTMAAFLARKCQVLGVDTDKSVLETLSHGKAHFFEVGLDEAIKNSTQLGSLEFCEAPRSLRQKVVFILTIGTPLKDQSVNLQALTRASSQIASVAKDEDLVIVRSTVSIGSTRHIVARALMDANKATAVAMCPERTIEGRALDELQSLPQIVGGLTKADTQIACDFFADHDVETVSVSSPEAAEMAKLANNTYRDLQFSFANELAVVSDVAGLNAREVIAAANYNYPRSNIALPGLTAGPCLEKDPWILYQAGQNLGVEMSITRASRINNESSPRLAVAQLLNRYPQIPKCARVLIAGLAFKGTPETDDTRGSLAFPLMEELSKNLPEMELWTYDPLVAASKLPTELSKNHLLDLGAISGQIDLLIIQHNGKRLLEALLGHPNHFKDSFVLDFWGDFSSELHPHSARPGVYVFGGEKND
jgi:UDP-N-acetyl-D-mannosaminuronic acid dehydrogenase